MKRILGSILAVGIGLSALTVPLMVQPSWGQTQNSQRQKLDQLLEQAKQQAQQGQPLKSIETLQKALVISRQLKDRELEATALLGLGFNYHNIRQRQKALEYFKQALPISKAVGDRSGEATTLNNIGFVYDNIGQPQKALNYYNQALPIYKEVGDRSGLATTLNNIGLVYHNIGQPQKALNYYNQALPIYKEVGDRSGEATTLNNIGSVYDKIGQPQKALNYYNQALPISKEVGHRSGEATTLNNIGLVYDKIGQPQKALNYYNQALPIYKEVGDRSGEATTLNNIGLVYDNIGQPQKALNYYNQALPIFKAVGDRTGLATTLNNIGGVYDNIGQPQKALAYYNQALPIFKAVGDRTGLATTLTGIGLVYDNIGQPQKALAYYNQALPIFKAVGDRTGEATTLNNIGLVYKNIGQPQKALNYYNQALPIRKEVGDRTGLATTLNNIGGVYKNIGQPQKALNYYNQALPIRKEVGDRSGVATTLTGIGLVYDNIGQPQKAFNYYNQALPIIKEVGDRSGEATTLNNIGLVYDNIGQPQKAFNYYNQALPIYKEVGDRSGVATTLNNIGLVYDNIGQPQKAFNYYNQALPIYKEVGDRSGVATTLTGIGLVYRNTKRPTEAIEKFEEAVKITLEMRGDLKRENRQTFLQSEARTAVALVDLLIDQNQRDKAYEWVNLASTAELADYTRLINAKVANSDTQKAIDDWNQKNQQLQFVQQQLQQNFSDERSRKMRELEAQVNKQAEDISGKFPEVGELFETKLTDIEQLRKNIPSGTVIVHPVLLTDTTNVLNSIAIFVLTKDKLTVTKKPIKTTELKLLTQYRQQLENRSDPNYLNTSQKLYDILIRPVEREIQSSSPTQLSIIATGELRYFPFETLYDSKTEKYLIQKYPVNYLTRISPRSWQNPSQMQPTAMLQSFISLQNIAVFVIIGGIGFLTFRRFGIVAVGILIVVSGGIAFWLVSGSTAGVLAIGNPKPVKPFALDGAEEEVKSVTKILPRSELYIRQEATLDKFKTQASRFRLLHLATHGCFQLDGCKNLGMDANTILFADQQYNIADAALLGLQNTELLTLSACQTAKESVSDGQTISGVAYVFERAGAKAIIASLWNADDNATKEIMIQFYQNIKNGMSKGEALQKAKLSQIKSHPFYWSPFILIGDAR